MKRQEVDQIEKLLAATFRRAPAGDLNADWQTGVMGAVRRHHAAAVAALQPVAAPLMSLRVMWRLSVCSIVMALVCAAAYMMSPSASSNGTTITVSSDVPLDSYENAVTVVARL